MSDLISRKAVIELIESKCTNGCLGSEDERFIGAGELMTDISDLPVAYDVDKILNDLEDLKCFENPYDSYYDSAAHSLTTYSNKEIYSTVNKAIEIVKGGGANE